MTQLQALAMSMLKRTLFPDDGASAETIWRQQRPEVRDLWRRRANEVMNDLQRAGYLIEKQENCCYRRSQLRQRSSLKPAASG